MVHRVKRLLDQLCEALGQQLLAPATVSRNRNGRDLGRIPVRRLLALPGTGHLYSTASRPT